MPRRGSIKTRLVDADPILNSRVVTKVINVVMREGKKAVAQKNVYSALKKVEEKGLDPLVTLQKALDNIGPSKKVRPRRVGGASYLIPISVRGVQKQSLAIRWLIDAANRRDNGEYKTFDNKLAAELIDAAEGKGGAVEKRQTAHKVADANRAFAHFRW